MADSALSAADLTALLERFALRPAGAKRPGDVSQAEIELLLARISALTSALQRASGNEAARLATRLLLSDLALVAAQFRGGTNALAASLTGALEGLERVLGDESVIAGAG
jgi:hypothetical protein